MLRQNEKVRTAAARRFQRILVDEFQDTDPIQAEIAFLLACAGTSADAWYERRLLPGRLFMVGDPRQAIYRFRGADIATYRHAREAVERSFPGHVLHVTSSSMRFGHSCVRRRSSSRLGAQPAANGLTEADVRDAFE
jgi:CRISPR-associated exonuclease Cas4